MEAKQCFSCKRKFPLFLFVVNRSTYQIKAGKGVSIVCRLCNYKRAIKERGFMNRTDGKFEFVKASKKEIFIKFWLKK